MYVKNVKIGFKLKELREKSGYTQVQVAKFLNLDQTTIAKIESDERAISIATIEKMADLYGCELRDITNNSECKPLELAFRAKNVELDDMEAISRIKKLALNIRLMNRLLDDGGNNDR